MEKNVSDSEEREAPLRRLCHTQFRGSAVLLHAWINPRKHCRNTAVLSAFPKTLGFDFGTCVCICADNSPKRGLCHTLDEEKDELKNQRITNRRHSISVLHLSVFHLCCLIICSDIDFPDKWQCSFMLFNLKKDIVTVRSALSVIQVFVRFAPEFL